MNVHIKLENMKYEYLYKKGIEICSVLAFQFLCFALPSMNKSAFFICVFQDQMIIFQYCH